MSRYRGPKLRITRRLGTLPGLTQKQSKKKDRPGQHGKGSEGKRKTTEYGVRLEEKQKLKFNYGLTESQFAPAFDFKKRWHVSLTVHPGMPEDAN